MKTLLPIVLLSISLAGSAQQDQALDYFFPKSTVNKCQLVKPGEPNFLGNLYYLQAEDTFYTVSHEFDAGAQVGMTTSAYTIDGSSVRLIWESYTNLFGKKNFFYNRQNVVFKMPGEDPIEWFYINGQRQKIKCQARMVWKRFGQDSVKSVKVKKVAWRGKKETNYRWTEYYAFGIGYAGRDEGGSITEHVASQELNIRDIESFHNIIKRLNHKDISELNPGNLTFQRGYMGHKIIAFQLHKYPK